MADEIQTPDRLITIPNMPFSSAYADYCNRFTSTLTMRLMVMLRPGIPLEIIVEYVMLSIPEYAAGAFGKIARENCWKIEHLDGYDACMKPPFWRRRPFSERSIHIDLADLDDIRELATRPTVNDLDCVTHIVRRVHTFDIRTSDFTVARAVRRVMWFNGAVHPELVEELIAGIVDRCREFTDNELGVA